VLTAQEWFGFDRREEPVAQSVARLRQDAVRHLLAKFFRARMGARPMQLGDDVVDGVSDSRHVCQPVVGDDPIQRLDERGDAVRARTYAFAW
jgi:hypothetical protein